METDAAKQNPNEALDQVAFRGEVNLTLWREIKAGNVAEAVLTEQLRLWAMQDGAAIRSLDNEFARYAIDKVASNVAQCPPYAAALELVDPTISEKVRPAVERLQLNALYLELLTLLPSKVRERITEATPEVRALLRQSLTMEDFIPAMAGRFSWIPMTRIDETQQAVRSVISQLEGPDADDTQEMASEATTAERGEDTLAIMDRNQPGKAEKSDIPDPSETSHRAGENLPTPASGAENGFIAGATNVQDYPAHPIGDLLERVTYKSMKDGTVLYLLDEKPAFVDYGNKIIMKDGADTDDRAILAAMLLAKEKYGGAFEITGTSTFAQQAIAVMIKYRVDAHLKNPQQDLMWREMKAGAPPLAPEPGSPTNPVMPVDFRSITVDLTKPSSPAKDIDHIPKPSTEPNPVAASSIVDANNIPSAGNRRAMRGPESIPDVVRTSGQLMEHGPAPYDWVDGNKLSYYVTLKNADGISRTTWGVELPGALSVARANIGDTIELQNLGRIPVEVLEPVRNAAGEIIGSEVVQSHRNRWNANVSERVHTEVSSNDEVARPPSATVDTAPTAGRSNSIDMLEGTVVAFGAAPYHNKNGNAQSYFISLANSHGDVRTIWGIDLRRAVRTAGIIIGDQIQLENQGRTAVEVKKPSFDDSGNFVGTIPVKSHKVNWKITLESRSTDAVPGPVKVGGTTDPPRGTVAKTRRESTLVRAGVSDQDREPLRQEKHTVPLPAPARKRQRPRAMKA